MPYCESPFDGIHQPEVDDLPSRAGQLLLHSSNVSAQPVFQPRELAPVSLQPYPEQSDSQRPALSHQSSSCHRIILSPHMDPACARRSIPQLECESGISIAPSRSQDVSVVAGVDFGTLSVRISIFDKVRGKLGSAVAEYPLHSSASDPAPQDAVARRPDGRAHPRHARGRARQRHRWPARSSPSRSTPPAPASSSVGEGLVPLGEYYLWCDHRAAGEAAEITRAAHAFHGGTGFEGIDWCGGVYSSEWGWSKLLHWLRHNPEPARRSSSPRSSTATWSPPRSAASPTPTRSRAASAPWATSGCGTRAGEACRRRSS